MMGFKKKTRNIRRKEPVLRRISRTLKSRGAVRILKASACLASGLLISFGAWQFYHELIKSPYLSIKEIKINGNIKLSRREILELAGVNAGDNLLAVNTTDIKKNIRLNPWVAEVDIRRSFPNCLNINIKERKPVAFVNLDSLYFVDETGDVFKRVSLEDDIDLPVITGLTKEDIEEEDAASELAIKAVNIIHLLARGDVFEVDNISEINVDKTYGLTIYTMHEGARIELGNDGFTEKLERLEKIVKSRNGLTGIEFVGLNSDRGVVVRLASNKAQVSNRVEFKAKTKKGHIPTSI